MVQQTSLPASNPGTKSASIPSGEPAASAPAAKHADQPDIREQLEENNPKAAIESMKQSQAASAPMESDSWNPKTMEVPPAADVTSQPAAGSASTRKKRAGDELVPSRVGSGGGMESDTWSPVQKKAKLDPREEQTLAMVSKIGTATPKPKVSKDINNPEEGVNPFMSLEKFSGPEYGRHREFERRAIYKQNKHSQIQGYDFYIDEVDRKEERHYLYYYKVDPKTKSAKLIGIEKHDHVTFLSDYDIKSDGKAKIVRY